MTLMILAAGMGSRFGGLKQIEPIGPNGEFIIDYSIFDAIRAGFNKVVFIIKEEMYDEFKNTIGKRIENHVEVEYLFQRLEDIPVNIETKRNKPWGTAQAVLTAKNSIHENFAIINADDYYGRDSFVRAYNFLKEIKNDTSFGLIGYKAINTITENGSVKRGILEIKDGKLNGIIESKIELKGDKIHCVALDNNNEFEILKDRLVNMNMILFTPKIFEYLERDFKEFLLNIKDKENDEFLLTNVIDKHIKNNDITVDIVETTSKWHGVTYKDDTPKVKEAINNMVKNNKYKEKLWE